MYLLSILKQQYEVPVVVIFNHHQGGTNLLIQSNSLRDRYFIGEVTGGPGWISLNYWHGIGARSVLCINMF